MPVNWKVTFYSEGVEAEIQALARGFVGRFLRYAERMEIYGPDLGMPHTRPMGEGLFELRLKAAEGIARVFFLHGDWPEDRGTSPVRQEERKDSEQGNQDCAKSNEGNHE